MSDTTGPAAELAGFREQRRADKIDQKTYLAHAERLGPLIEQGATSSASSGASQAQAKIADLAQQRSDGKLSQAQFLEQMEQLGPQAYADDVTLQGSDGSTVTVSAEEHAELEKVFATPKGPEAYRFSHDTPDSDEARAWDSTMRAGFHAAGVPQTVASVLNDTANKLVKQFEKAAPGDIEQHVASVGNQLRSAWGAEYDAKIARIDKMLDEVKGPFGQILDDMPWVIADPLVFTQLDALAEHRSRKRQG